VIVRILTNVDGGPSGFANGTVDFLNGCPLVSGFRHDVVDEPAPKPLRKHNPA
jgi:hypothetical protein